MFSIHAFYCLYFFIMYTTMRKQDKYVINPITKRRIKVGGHTFKRLKRKNYQVFDLHDRTPGIDASAIKKIPPYVVFWKKRRAHGYNLRSFRDITLWFEIIKYGNCLEAKVIEDCGCYSKRLNLKYLARVNLVFKPRPWISSVTLDSKCQVFMRNTPAVFITSLTNSVVMSRKSTAYERQLFKGLAHEALGLLLETCRHYGVVSYQTRIGLEASGYVGCCDIDDECGQHLLVQYYERMSMKVAVPDLRDEMEAIHMVYMTSTVQDFLYAYRKKFRTELVFID